MPVIPLDVVVGPGQSDAFERLLLRAEVVYNGVGMPRPAAAVLLQRAGSLSAGQGGSLTVADVRNVDVLTEAYPDATLVDCGFAISPPVVNAFVRLGSVADARRAVGLLASAGTTVVGVAAPEVEALVPVITDERLTGVAYLSVPPRPEDEGAVLEGVRASLTDLAGLARPGGFGLGVALDFPAGPLEGSGLRTALEVARWARSAGVPLVLDAGRLRGPDVQGGAPSVAALAAGGLLDGEPTLVGFGALAEEDVRAVARASAVFVMCPWEERAAGLPAFPWILFAKHAAEVAFGTGTAGALSDLDVTAEVRLVMAERPDATNPRQLVRAAVKGGSKALGLRAQQVVRGADAAGLVVWADPAA